MPRRFLEVVFSEKDHESFLQVFTLPDKQVRFFADLNKTIQYVHSKQESNVYIGVGTRPRSFVESTDGTKRGSEKDVDAIYALWADVDVLSPAHKKKNLPPTKNDAKELIHSVGLPPTIIIS